MTDYCDHTECVADAIQDLRFIAKVLPMKLADTLLAEALLCTGVVMVRCRHVPRKSAPGLPTPPLP